MFLFTLTLHKRGYEFHILLLFFFKEAMVQSNFVIYMYKNTHTCVIYMYFVIYMYSVLLLFGTSTWPNSLALPSQLGRPYVPELVRVSLNVPASLQCTLHVRRVHTAVLPLFLWQTTVVSNSCKVGVWEVFFCFC